MGCHHLCQWPPLADPRSMLVAVPLPLASGDADVPRYGPPRRQRWTLQRQRQWERKSSLDLPQELSKGQHRNICECGPTHRFGQHSVASVFCFLSCSMLVHVISMSFWMFLIPCLAELAEPKGWSQLASSGWGPGPRKQLPCCEAETYKETCERCVRLR